MARLLESLLATIVISTAASAARAEPLPDVSLDSRVAPEFSSSYDSSFVGFSGACKPGTRVACSCPDGARSTRICEPSGVRFSLCACASVSVDLRPPVVVIETPLPPPPPVIRVRHRNAGPQKRSSGLGLLIGGGVTLAHGTASLIWGIERVRRTERDPLGIVLISTGGVAMAVGLPLTIVGIAFLATRGLHPDEDTKPKTQSSRDWKSGISFAPTANGFAVQF